MEKKKDNESKNKPQKETKQIGVRLITPAHRIADRHAREFTPGDDFNRFEPIDILDKIWPKLPRSAGKPKWSGELIRHLKLLVKMTQERDWREGQPIVWLSVEETADLLGRGTSQVNNNERALFELGALTWNDSPNHRRNGRREGRNGRGRIIEAYGVNLGPLGHLTKFLRQMSKSIEDNRQDRKDAKKRFGSLRQKIRRIFAAGEQWRDEVNAEEASFNDLIKTMSIKRKTRVKEIHGWSEQLMEFLERLDLLQEPAEHPFEEPVDNLGVEEQNAANMRPSDQPDTTPPSTGLDTHIIHKPNIYIEYNTSSAEDARAVDNSTAEEGDGRYDEARWGSSSTGLTSGKEMISQLDEVGFDKPDGVTRIRDVVNLPKFCRHLPEHMRGELEHDPDWRGVIKLAANECVAIGISPDAWHDARRIMGRDVASLAVIITAVKYHRMEVRTPGGYLRGMVKKARHGLFNLMPAIYGIQGSSHG